MSKRKLDPVHPGEILLLEFLEPMGISQNELGRSIGVPPRRINEIVLGKRRITADTALRLAKYFDMSAEFWMGLQIDYDLDAEIDRLGRGLDKDVDHYIKEDEAEYLRSSSRRRKKKRG